MSMPRTEQLKYQITLQDNIDRVTHEILEHEHDIIQLKKALNWYEGEYAIVVKNLATHDTFKAIADNKEKYSVEVVSRLVDKAMKKSTKINIAPFVQTPAAEAKND